MPKTTVMIAQKEIDLLKWAVRGLGGALIALIIWFAQQLYSQVQEQDARIGRLKERVKVLEVKAGIERPPREPSQ